MHEPLDPRYNHKAIEDAIYKKWESSGYFNPDNLATKNKERGVKKSKSLTKNSKLTSSAKREDPFTIIMPPPNANGSLHLGHAVFVTLQDIMTRYARMKGKKTLWLPGADHAGFETQVVFDKKLEKEGRNRFAMDRETLWKEIWDFTQQNKKVMESQLRKLGASCDWSREKFTLDPDIVRIVYDTFEKMYRDGLVERDAGIISWCPKHQTSLSDLEIKDIERTDSFYYFRYGPFTIGTARPETKFGDKYVVMHPDDTRYKEYKNGEQLHLEWINGPLTATIIKDEAMDMEFGSGVMTITPWHSTVDFDIAMRHGLDKEQVIDERGRLLPIAGEFAGMKILEARPKIVEKLRLKGLLARTDEAYRHTVRACYKCNTLIEPQIKKQWFVRMTRALKTQAQKTNRLPANKIHHHGVSLRDMAVKAATSGKMKFHPTHAKKILLHWMENIRDWNISRQIVWGIRIPAWFCASCGEIKVNATPKAKLFLVRHGETDWNKEERGHGHANPPLNNAGIAYAGTLATRLRAWKIEAIITSDLHRARHTAEIIAHGTNARIIPAQELRGRNVGIAQGMYHTERRALYGDIFQSYEKAPPGGESFKDFEERTWSAFREHRTTHRHKNIVIVTHIETIHAILKRTKKWSMEQMIARQSEKSGFTEFDILDPCLKCKNDLYEQDPDVFDTWFSSGQWPFATLLASQETKNKEQGVRIPTTSKDLKTFYPTSVMETGHDILFFWVARMIMFGLYRTGEVPFRTVYLHGLVRDKDRQKMSKSKGNVIDPLGVAEEYGTDAVRMALVMGNTAGNDILISEDKIRGYRNFATKLWNIARFILMYQNKTEIHDSTHPPAYQIPKKYKFTATDKKFLAEAKKIKTEVGKHIEKFEVHLAAEKAYHYVWHTFADTIIEHYKPKLQKVTPPLAEDGTPAKPHKIPNKTTREKAEVARHILNSILMDSLIILHPFMPFITESIYEKIDPKNLLMTKPW
ncbi:MAG: class I tRNA ligase family protein [Patescibacteria group bacterium]|nr:class I tRNA ligase family protein [Patescibacteria group bacterium]